MDWFRCYHGITHDAKWPLIARMSIQPVGVVVSVWMALLEHASQADERGSVEDFDCEVVDALYGYEDGTTGAVLAAMKSRGLVCEGRLVSWVKRQPAREDAVGPEAKSGAQRVREHRARKKAEADQRNAQSRDVTNCNASVTQCNAQSRDVTPQNREEKIREEKYTPPLPPSPGGGACASPAPLSGEDIAEAKDAVRQERRRGDYEFSLLRSEYDKARQEGPMAGRQEFLQLFGSPDFPGLDEILAGLQRLLEQDDQFRRGFAPGLGRFVRERMWAMHPRAPAGEKPQGETPEQEQSRREYQERKQAYLDGLKAKKAGRKK